MSKNEDDWTTIGIKVRTAMRFNKARGRTNQDDFLTQLMNKAGVKQLEDMSAFVSEPKTKESEEK